MGALISDMGHEIATLFLKFYDASFSLPSDFSNEVTNSFLILFLIDTNHTLFFTIKKVKNTLMINCLAFTLSDIYSIQSVTVTPFTYLSDILFCPGSLVPNNLTPCQNRCCYFDVLHEVLNKSQARALLRQ